MLTQAHKDHRRVWKDFFYVYPVVSRRSKGVSIGINLNPDKVCNFDCVYCEVDRKSEPRTRSVDMEVLEQELRTLIELHQTGKLFEEEPFASTPLSLRRLNDLAFSGDGEPTTFRKFAEVVERVAKIKQQTVGNGVKLVLITNATGLDRMDVRQGLEVMDLNQGEVWGKLDAGTEAYYQKVDRSSVRFDRILKNLTQTALVRPIFIQSLFLRVRGEVPPLAEIDAYIGCLQKIRTEGGQICEVQVYTVARPTPEPWAIALRPLELDSIAHRIHEKTGIPVSSYQGAFFDGT